MSPEATPPTSRHTFRFGLPSSLGANIARVRADRLENLLSPQIGKLVQVQIAPSYDALAKDVQEGRLDAVWAPPFVCARLESQNLRVLVRGRRKGASTYRAALLARAGSGLTLETLQGKRVAWVDRDSVAGFLLPLALLKGKGLEPAKLFSQQQFVGSYRAALEAVLEGKADVASVFCPPKSAGTGVEDSLEQLLPGKSGAFELVATTDEAPNDGVCLAASVSPEAAQALEAAFVGMRQSADGQHILQEVFGLDGFEPAPKMGYRALYRVALSTL
ncbi:MAG TPA: phosphate/phosphite/phosphonate ABC transporter substrate-binding protein [Aggregicoccus sp.]|nr:phosphate/phosphite/phosphonate ABC transporter substrate-binding protein [Aggregicoccus sp.]